MHRSYAKPMGRGYRAGSLVVLLLGAEAAQAQSGPQPTQVPAPPMEKLAPRDLASGEVVGLHERLAWFGRIAAVAEPPAPIDVE